MSDDDDDVPQLSSQALSALQEFYREKQQREDLETIERFNNCSLGSVGENWVSRCIWNELAVPVEFYHERAGQNKTQQDFHER